MPSQDQDARLQELTFLSKLERSAVDRITSEQLFQNEAFKSMVLHLLHSGCLNGLETVPFSAGSSVVAMANAGGRTNLQVAYEQRLWGDIARLVASQEVFVRISHQGRVRRSELEQALRTGREREPFGILLAMRYVESAVAMALLAATTDSPVSVAYFDMNGLKAINDKHGHAAGTSAIKAYVQVIAAGLGENAEGFRGEGGDEVVVVMRDTSAEAARLVLGSILSQLEREYVIVEEAQPPARLTASCGIASAADPQVQAKELIERADRAMFRAKEASRTATRSSVLAVEGRPPESLS